MIVFGLVLPLLVALLIATLSRRLPARPLAFAGALALLVSGGVLLLAAQGWLGAAPAYPWLSAGGTLLQIALVLNWPWTGLAVLACWTGAAVLLHLGLALAPGLRNFGGAVAALTAVPALTVAGLTLPLPVAVAPLVLLTLLSFAASRSVAAHDRDAVPASLLAGLAAAALLVVAPLWPAAALWLLLAAGWIGAGLPPFGAARDDLTDTPGVFGALLVPVGAPLLAPALAARALAELTLPPNAPRALLLALLALALVCGAAATLNAPTIRRRAARAHAALAALALAGAVIGSSAASASTLAALLAGGAALFLAAAVAERRAGTDDLDTLGGIGRPGVGIVTGVSMLSLIGAPGLAAYWGLLPLLAAQGAAALWLVALLVPGFALLAASLLGPLATLLRAGPASEGVLADTLAPTLVMTLLAAVALVQVILDAPGWLPITIGTLLVGAVAFWFVGRVPARQEIQDAALPPGALPSMAALAETVQPLAQIAAPRDGADAWAWITDGGAAFGTLLRPIMRRYYLAWVLVGLVVVIFVLL